MINPLENGHYLWEQLRSLTTVESRYMALHTLSQEREAAIAATDRVRRLHRAVIVRIHVCDTDCVHPLEAVAHPEVPHVVCEHCWNSRREAHLFYRQPAAVAWPCDTICALDPTLGDVRTEHLTALNRRDTDAALAIVTAALGCTPHTAMPLREEVRS